MGITLDEMMELLSPARRVKVEARAAELIGEEKLRRRWKRDKKPTDGSRVRKQDDVSGGGG